MFGRGEQRKAFPTATPVRRRPALDFSLTGLTYSAMMLFMGLAAINSQANLLFGVFGLMIGVLVVSGAISKLVLRKLEIRRALPEQAVVGEPVAFRYEFHNEKRYWPSLSVTLSELDGAEAFTKQPQAYLLHAAAGMTASVPVQVVPKRRGLHQLDRFQVGTSFPFGFIKRAAERRRADVLLVYPPLARVDPKLLAQCVSADQSGTTMRPRRGGTDEFYGLKEYRTGENPRFIHWKRSARTGALVSKEMTHVAPPRLVLMVDTHVDPGRRGVVEHAKADQAAVERAIAMAGSLASHALEQGLAVGLHAWSGGWVGVSPSRGKRHRRELMEALARLSLNTTKRTGDLVEHAHRMLKPGTTGVLVTPGEVERSLREAVRANWVVLSAVSEQSQAYFAFPPGIDFTACMPPDQEPTIEQP